MNAEASTVSHRNPIASLTASVNGTPRTARLATASSHRTSVRMVEAAKTTAYWRRKAALVKSTLLVEWTASESLPTIQEAASAQPLESEARGSRAVWGSLGEVEDVPPVPLPPWQ